MRGVALPLSLLNGYPNISMKNKPSYNSTTQLKDKQPNCPNAKRAKDLNRRFSKDDRQTADSTQGDTNSISRWEMRIKTTKSYHFISNRIHIILQNGVPSAGEDVQR